MGKTVLLIIDNYDSFTYNLAQYFMELGEQILVEKNDAITPVDIENLAPTAIVISPGPCSPKEAGISNAVIAHFAGVIPIFGVCLGHQCIAEVFGGKVVGAHQVCHGKVSPVCHHHGGVFRHLPNPLTVARYHSLVVDKDSLPKAFEITAWIEDDRENVIMGIRHKTLPIEGVQFHPESFLSEAGHDLLKNFLMDVQVFNRENV